MSSGLTRPFSSIVGSRVGYCDGFKVGARVLSGDGTNDGVRVGNTDGCSVGVSVYESGWAPLDVGTNVGMPVPFVGTMVGT